MLLGPSVLGAESITTSALNAGEANRAIAFPVGNKQKESHKKFVPALGGVCL
jgi:hypothetical protein